MVVGAVHQYLIRQRQRMKVGIIVETGQVKTVHEYCVMLGFGADAICPYLVRKRRTSTVTLMAHVQVYETIHRLRRMGLVDSSFNNHAVFDGYCNAVMRGILKVMAKMGISTLHSYKVRRVDRLLPTFALRA